MPSLAIIALLSLGAITPARAQLIPDRLYYGVGRAVPMTIKIPADLSGEPSVKLFSPDAKDPIASAAVAAGSVNFATLFPTLWTDKAPKVLYAQLIVGERKVGSPVVLQPMLDVVPPRLDDTGRRVIFTPRRGQLSGYRAYSDRRILFDTTAGPMEFRLRPDQAPNTAWNFIQLVEGGFYTDIAFHRVMPKFVIQVGDPMGTGEGGPGYFIDMEPSKLRHDFGVLSMARQSGDCNTNGSQVFVCLSREMTSMLDDAYTAFGQIVTGQDTVKAIASVEIVPGTDRPKSPPRIKTARTVPAPPYGEAAPSLVMPLPATKPPSEAPH